MSKKISQLTQGRKATLGSGFIPVALPGSQTYKVPVSEFGDPVNQPEENVKIFIYGTDDIDDVFAAIDAGKVPVIIMEDGDTIQSLYFSELATTTNNQRYASFFANRGHTDSFGLPAPAESLMLRIREHATTWPELDVALADWGTDESVSGVVIDDDLVAFKSREGDDTLGTFRPMGKLYDWIKNKLVSSAFALMLGRMFVTSEDIPLATDFDEIVTPGYYPMYVSKNSFDPPLSDHARVLLLVFKGSMVSPDGDECCVQILFWLDHLGFTARRRNKDGVWGDWLD